MKINFFLNFMFLYVVFGEVLYTQNASVKNVHPDLGLNVFELVQKYGYPIEAHSNVVTEDGYVLELHRIPHGKNNSHQINKPPVLLMHSFLFSSADWVNMGPEKSLVYLLADLGYDVWIANARGNTWSRKHNTMDPDIDKMNFWNFSWDEMGTYDIPAMIDYITNTTSQEKIFYIGHSQATTAFFVMGSQRPEYNEKIRLMVAFAPMAYIDNLYSPLFRFFINNIDSFKEYADSLSIYEILSHSKTITDMGQLLCNDDAVTQVECINLFFALAGDSPEQLNATMIPVITSNFPAGIATKQVYHYAQVVSTGEFKRYDYGLAQNLEIYGQETAPLYNLTKITAPLAIYYSKNDWLLAVEDAQRVVGDLPNVVVDRLIAYEKFNHLDFLWAIDVKTLLYNEVFEVMKNY